MLRHRLLRQVLASCAREPGYFMPSDVKASGDEGLGLGDDRLRALAVEHRFGSIASLFPRLGGPLELRVVAWWGSALADIACAAGPRGRDEDLLADAARFYLAVALFDDVVDGAPDRAGALAPRLHPSRLRRKLEQPALPEGRLQCPAPDLGLIVALFDTALEGMGSRFGGDPGRCGELAEMLEAMYRSELSLSDDPVAAKILPFVLIGHLALAPEQREGRAFFGRLAELLGLWDDWQDLPADGWARTPNAHLGRASPASPLRGLLRGLGLGLMGMVPSHPVSSRLVRALGATLDAARVLSPGARGKTDALLLHMLGGRLCASPLTGPAPDAGARIASRARASGTVPPHARGSA